MTLLSNKVSDLFGGVSQVPAAQRPPNKWTELLNSLPIYGKRLGRRPPLLHITKLLGTALTTATSLVHSVTTSSGRRAQLIVSATGLVALDADTGLPITVLSPDGTGSFGGAGMRAASNGDTTVVTNPATVVAKAATKAPAALYEALLYVRQGDYSTVYTVVLDGTTISYTTPDSTAVGALAATATDKVATAIMAALQANAGIAALYYIAQYGSTLYLARKNGTDFTVTVTDGIADKGLLLIKGTIQRFSDLPTKARPGVIVEVTGDQSSAFTKFYVRYRAPAGGSGNGVWKEVPKPGSNIALDGSTLPFRCTFRGNLLEPTAHVDTTLNLPLLSHTGLGPSYVDVFVAFPSDVLYPAGTTFALTLSATTFNYAVGATAQTARQVAAGLYALVLANVSFVPVMQTPEMFVVTPAAGFISSSVTGGYNNATTFATTDVLPASLTGYTIENVTDGSTGVIIASTSGTIVVAALVGGTANLFHDGDLCRVIASGDYFVYGKAPWDNRISGDDTTVPFPSLVGKAVNEVFFHQGRLGLVSKSSVLLSRSASSFGLFRASATQVLSDDPIDIKNTTGSSSPFHSAVEWNGALYLFSATLQYVLDGGNAAVPITASSVRIHPVSRYLSDSRVRPVVAGNRLYFVALKSGFPRVLEYSIKGYEQLHNAEDTGRELPTYFQGNAVALVVDDTQGLLLFLTDGNSQKTLYAYSYRYIESEKVAAGWGQWTFPNTIVGLDCVDGHVGVLTSHPDGTYLNMLLLDPQALASYDTFYGDLGLLFGGFTFGTGLAAGGERVTYLDRRVSLDTGATVAFAGGTTTWTLPYNVAVDGSEGTLVVATQDSLVLLTTTRPASNQIAAVGDFSGNQVYIGILYTTLWSFSTLFLRDKNGEADERGRLQVRWLRLRYVDSSDMTATVTIAGRPALTYGLNAAIGSGILLVPIQGRNTDASIVVSNTTPGAGNLVSYDWEGTHHTRERAF